jgi:putative ABC transport system substrate-binding protein
MDRRAFVGSLTAGVLAVTRGARAQSPRKVYRIGILGTAAASDLAGPQPRSPTTLAFLRGMREQGYVYGEHFVTEVRGADGKLERFSGLAAELVGLQMDMIVAPGPALPALKQATSTIPIIMAASSDPVGSGHVQSLSRPGGNITGLSLQSVDHGEAARVAQGTRSGCVASGGRLGSGQRLVLAGGRSRGPRPGVETAAV